MHDSSVKEVWGTSPAKLCCVDAVGSVGGILVVWTSRSFLFKDRWVATFVILVLFEDLTKNSVSLVSYVYGSNESRKRDLMWSELDSIHNRWNGPWCIGEIGMLSDFPLRSWVATVTTEMVGFSDWINKHSLVDLQLGGATFTWSNHQSLLSSACLDRFLIFSDWLNLFPEACQSALPNQTIVRFFWTPNVKDGAHPHFDLSSCGWKRSTLIKSKNGGRTLT